MQSGISRRTASTSSSVSSLASSSTSTSASTANNVYRSRPSTLIPHPNKVTSRTSDDKKMIGTVKSSTLRRPSSRETIATNINSRIDNGSATTNGFIRPNSTSVKQPVRLTKIDSTPAQPSRPAKGSTQMSFNASTASSINRRLTNGISKTDSKLTAHRNEITSSSVRKSVAPSLSNAKNSANSTAINVNNSLLVTGTAKKSVAGTATARAATTLISLQKECDKYKKLADLYKRQLEASKGDVSKSVMVVDGLSVVVRYLNEHLNAFSTPSLKATIERQALNYEKLKGDYSKLENLLDQMRQENTRKEDDLKDEIVRINLEVVNEKKRHDNEKNRLFDMFEDQMEAQKKAFKKEMEKVEEDKVNLEKVIDSLKDEISDKIRQIEVLTNRVGELESSLSMEKDRRCRMLQEKVKFMTSEIQSLKDVLDLKDGELRTLKTSIANEELLRQELVTAQQSIINLTQRLEQLEISANQKNAMINMLKEENESLRERYNREQRERRRISMKNEELEYTLSEFTTPGKGNSSSMDEDIFLTPMQPPSRSRLTLASVPPSRPHSTDSIRKARESYSVARPSHHHAKCFQPSSSNNLPPSSSSSVTLTCSTSSSSVASTNKRHHRHSSASTKLTFQDAITVEDSTEDHHHHHHHHHHQHHHHHSQHNTHIDGVYNLPDSYDYDEVEDNDLETTPNFEDSNVYKVSTPTRDDCSNKNIDQADSDQVWQANKRRSKIRAGGEDEEDEEERKLGESYDTATFGAINNSFDKTFRDNRRSINNNNNIIRTESSQSSSPTSPVNSSNLSNPIDHQHHRHHQTTSSSASSSTNGEGTSGIGSSLNSISVHSGVTFRSERSEDDSESETPKSLPSVLPQSILDSGFEDIEGLIAFR